MDDTPDLPFDPTQIISDDPNDRPDYVATAGATAAIAAASQPTPDVISPQSNLDPTMARSGNTDWGYWSQTNTAGPNIAAGSNADAVQQAISAGYSWSEVNDYLNTVQPLNGGMDTLVKREPVPRPSLDNIWYGGPN